MLLASSREAAASWKGASDNLQTNGLSVLASGGGGQLDRHHVGGL